MALAAIMPTVPAKPPREVLKGLKFSAQIIPRSTLTIYTTNMELYATYQISDDLSVNKPGEFVVPAQTFNDYIKSLDDDLITLLVTPDDSLEISGKDALFSVGTLDIEEYPRFPDYPQDNIQWIEVSYDIFKTALGRASFAVADKGHPRWGALSAICMDFNKDEISLIGTDQKRASVASVKVKSDVTGKTLLLAADAVETIPKFFNDDFELALRENPNSLLIRQGNSNFQITPINGNFPPVKKFIPNHPNKMKITTLEFLSVVKKAALAAGDASALKISVVNSDATITAKTKEERRSSKVVCKLDNTGPNIDFQVNWKYLVDVLKVCPQEVELFYNRSNQPILIKADQFEHIIVPQEAR